MDLAFESLSPQEAAESNTKLVITTRAEAKLLSKKEILLDTELLENPVLSKAKILRSIMGEYQNDQLIIGIDPGNRIGLSIIYLQNEIESLVVSSPISAVDLIIALLEGIQSKKKTVKIGDGDIAMSQYIARMIKMKLKNVVTIEIVDEYGTSLPRSAGVNRRGIRDKLSAKTIALRSGRLFLH
jgi:ribosomal protein S24E